MSALISGIFLFGIAFLIHLFFWKIRIPKHQIRILLLIFFLSFVAGILTFIYFPEGSQFIEAIAPKTLAERITFTIFFSTLTVAYCFLYTGLIDEGPSLTFVLNIDEAGGEGIDKSALEGLITEDTFMRPRVNFLVQENFASKAGEKYIISSKGIFFLETVNKLRKGMNISHKVG